MSLIPTTTWSQASKEFYYAGKGRQRQLLDSAGLPTPNAYPSERIVQRPHRHFGGSGFQLVGVNDQRAGGFYYSPLFEKRHEYRVIFVYGTPVVILKKTTDGEYDPAVPWNHSHGFRFVTVLDHSLCRLRHSGIIDQLKEFYVVKDAHLVAADIMLRRKAEAAVCELNFCPGIQIEANLSSIIAHIRGL